MTDTSVYWRAERLWPGATFVCIASGPSLHFQDIDHVRKAHERGACRAIAINNCWQRARWADVLYAADYRWWRKHDPQIEALKVSVSPEKDGAWPGVLYLRDRADVPGLSRDPGLLHQGFAGSTDGHSGYQAIGLAFHLGAGRIVLLGYDMKLGPNQERHWHGDHEGLNNPGEEQIARWARCYPSLAADLKSAGIEVINCTRDTALTCFPRADIREVL